MKNWTNAKWIESQYEQWCNAEVFDPETRQEVRSIMEQDEIYDRFRAELTFGTGGLRGIMGAGLNRMNGYVVRKATAGLANYLLQKDASAPQNGVVIAYDSRKCSREFAIAAAEILSTRNIKVYLFTQITPTPVLSFAVRTLRCCAGIVITASHNPKEYNGYKVYDDTGCQVTTKTANAIYEEIQKIDLYRDIPALSAQKNASLVTALDEALLRRFVQEVKTQSVLQDTECKNNLNVRYTSLHGTGFRPVMMTLREDGFAHVFPVLAQAEEDGAFPTVQTPNPEDRDALAMGIAQAAENGDDIVLGTDPDCDRVGVAVLHHGKYELLTGNQLGALLISFLLERNPPPDKNATVVKTIVTNDLGEAIAKKHGLQVVNTLTGFKYIGEQINQFQQSGDHVFFMGYEESFGFLVGTHARDKDAVVSSMLICEMAAYAKSQGKTLVDWLQALYLQYGYYLDQLETIACSRENGEAEMQGIMENFRQHAHSYLPQIDKQIDYQKGVGGFPPSNVIKLIFTDQSWIAVRPSGTEPKMKFYYSARGESRAHAEERLAQLHAAVQKILHIEKHGKDHDEI